MTNDFKPVAANPGDNVESQADYLLDFDAGGALEHGNQDGTVESARFNKQIRQSSVMAYAVAQAISDLLAQDVLDDGNLAALVAQIKSAITVTNWSTGDVKFTLKTVADAGWVFCNDGTIGDAASGAVTRANADCHALYIMLWNIGNGNAFTPVTGGRGANAEADWGAHKPIALTKMVGRVLAVSGGGVLGTPAIGAYVGEDTHLLTEAEMPTHHHGYNASPYGADFRAGGGAAIGVPTPAITDSTGGSQAHNNMQPTGYVNAMIKL